MSGSSSVAAMKKVVQQLRLEAGLNRVKVSGRGRAVGPGVGGKREATRGSSGRAGPRARRGPALPPPADSWRSWRVPPATSVSHVSPQTHSQPSSLEHTRVRPGSSRQRPEEQLLLADRPGSPRTPPSLGPASNKEVFGADAAACSRLTLLGLGCLFTGSHARETDGRWPGTLRSCWGVGSRAVDFWGQAFCPCW